MNTFQIHFYNLGKCNISVYIVSTGGKKVHGYYTVYDHRRRKV